MLKRDDITKASKLDGELSVLEQRAAHWRNIHTIEVSGRDGVYRIELGDYPEPSEIGRAFLSVQTAIVRLCEAQAAPIKAELTKLGVESEPR